MPVEAKERQLPVATSPNLDDMKLPELKELAKQMGLRGVSTMRKTELIATLQAARSGGQAPAGVTVRAPKSAPAADAEVKSAKDKKADEAKQEERPVRAKQAKSAESSEVADAVAAVDALKPNDEAPKRRRHRDAEAGADLLAELELTSGRDLKAWSAQWLEESGINTIATEVEENEDGTIKRLALRQTAPAEHPVLRAHRLAVGFYNEDPQTGMILRTDRL